MNEQELSELRARWNAARTGPVRIYPPLPRRVRLRLWLTRQINGAGIWLVNHGHEGAAIALWRACGMW